MKQYKLTLCKDEPDEEITYAELTDEQVKMIERDIAGEISCQQVITTCEGLSIETGIIDAIEEIPPEVDELADIISGILRDIDCFLDYDFTRGCPEEIIANALINEYGYKKH